MLTNSAGTSTAIHSYGPFGEPNVTTGVRFRYTGQQYLGGLNLDDYKARFYSPALGRFLQTDPIGTADDLNLYAYVGNNPVNFSDPTGLYWFRQSWQTPGTVGRPNTPVEPGGAVSEFIERYVPGGYTFGEMHDGFVDVATRAGFPDWLINLPSMIPAYVIAVGTEVLRTTGFIEQPTLTAQSAQTLPLK